MTAAADSVADYAKEGFVAFSVDIHWDPAAKNGEGKKKSTHPCGWPTAGGKARAHWNSVALNTELSNLVVIDIDSDEAYVSFKKSAEAAGIDLNTREAKSGSGRGGHIYFRTILGGPPLKSIDNIGIFDMRSGESKVDVKAAGGLIYAPPSRYIGPKGSVCEYRWVDENVPIAVLPGALQDLLPKQNEPRQSSKTKIKTKTEKATPGIS